MCCAIWIVCALCAPTQGVNGGDAVPVDDDVPYDGSLTEFVDDGGDVNVHPIGVAEEARDESFQNGVEQGKFNVIAWTIN